MKHADTWSSFQEKLKYDTLTVSDFTTEMGKFLQPLLCGERSALRRQKFLDSPYDIYEGSEKVSVISHCADDDYRFDFLSDGTAWKLAFIECITLPISDIDDLPYTKFIPLEGKEFHIRREKEISRLVYFYLKFKELVGKENALALLHDGDGEFICARSWVPFYSDSLSYIAYSAWYESRIHGENVVIKEFRPEKCEVMIYDHIWKSMYCTAGHLKSVIEYPEYMELFESIWKNRATSAGWKIQFVYTDTYTSLIFHRSSNEHYDN